MTNGKNRGKLFFLKSGIKILKMATDKDKKQVGHLPTFMSDDFSRIKFLLKINQLQGCL